MRPLPAEVILQALWGRRLFRSPLRTVAGERVEVLDPGQLKGEQGGPDFRGARLRIGQLLWVGDVEVDPSAEDWFQHRHHENPLFETVIAQVVWEAAPGSRITDRQGRAIPIIALAPHVEQGLHERLNPQKAPFPCAPLAREVPAALWEALYDAKGEERLRSRHGHYRTLESLYAAFWEALLYGLGLPDFGEAFREIARAVRLMLLTRYQGEVLSMEALLLGVAGLLEGQVAQAHPYEGLVLERWAYLRAKHDLRSLPLRWGRFRPVTSPAIRLSIAANLLHQHPETGMLLAHPPEALPLPSPYWQEHWAWQKPLSQPLKKSSQFLERNLRINALYPFGVYYFRLLGHMERALEYIDRLRQLPPEHNRITRLYATSAHPAQNAWQSQGQLFLWRTLCSQQKCMDCPIGLYLRQNG